jgi:hypothetical protein
MRAIAVPGIEEAMATAASGSIQWKDEARKSRRRLYPVSAIYTAYSLAVIVLALRSAEWGQALAYMGGGVLAWTLIEYLVHRYILHGEFPEGPGVARRFLHRHFDHLHRQHHARPWDGNHINGDGKDTGPFVAVFIALSWLGPVHTWPVFFATLLQCYIVEEWIHHSVHFYHFRNPYFRYIRRHHLYHHSPKGAGTAYGLTSGVWDVACQTRIAAQERRRLYQHKHPFRGPATEQAVATHRDASEGLRECPRSAAPR